MSKKPILLFPHIGRTGGDYFFNYINGALPKFSSVHYDIKEYLWNDFRYLNNNHINHLKFIAGHGVIYGTHEYIDASTEYIALLRDPVKRIISQYHAYMNDNSYKIHEKFKEQNLSLSVFAEQYSNMQTKRLTGWPYYYNDDELNSWTLDNCIAFFNSVYKYVGVTERLTEFVTLVRDRLDIDTEPLLSRRRQAEDKKKIEDIDPEVIEKIKECNIIDQALYDEALKRVEANYSKLSEAKRIEIDDFNKRQSLFADAEKNFDFEIFSKLGMEKILFKGKLNVGILHTRKKNFPLTEAKELLLSLNLKFEFTDLNIILSESFDATPSQSISISNELIDKINGLDYVILITDEGQDFILGNALKAKGMSEEKLCFILNSVPSF